MTASTARLKLTAMDIPARTHVTYPQGQSSVRESTRLRLKLTSIDIPHHHKAPLRGGQPTAGCGQSMTGEVTRRPCQAGEVPAPAWRAADSGLRRTMKRCGTVSTRWTNVRIFSWSCRQPTAGCGRATGWPVSVTGEVTRRPCQAGEVPAR